ncbi:MAG TPA: hypothetical protein VFU00_04025 [Gemmatimonadales bacterium]|nr:hypothetical protein [Gemmatimonadales bacterium]
MFIEAVDHLRCPAPHPEQHLVLLPSVLEERSVRSGMLGCPVCGREFAVEDGVLDVGGGPESVAPTALDGDAAAALLGLSGPGGYIAVVGGMAGRHDELAAALPGIRIVTINPPGGVRDGGELSVLRGGTIPLRSSSMRGVLLGPGFGSDPSWVAEAVRVTLSGLRIVGEGNAPESPDIEVMATAGGCWVAAKQRNRM